MFWVTTQQMLILFMFIISGYILRKTKILLENADVTTALLETYIFVPARSLLTQTTNCTRKAFAESYSLI